MSRQLLLHTPWLKYTQAKCTFPDAHDLDFARGVLLESKKAADLIESQFPYRNRIWITSMDKKITNDIIDIARDLEHEGRNGRNCYTTGVKGKGKKERWRVGNTMGYVSRTPSQWDITWYYHAVQQLPLVTLLCSLFSQFLLPTSRLPHPK